MANENYPRTPELAIEQLNSSSSIRLLPLQHSVRRL